MRRVAIIGLNVRAERLLIAGLLAADNCQLTAVVSRSQEKAAAIAAQFEIPHFFDSVDVLAASGVADTVFVNTPPAHHLAPALSAAQHGMAVICEKPLSSSGTSARQLAAAVRERGVPSAMHFTFHGLAGTRMIKHVVETGTLGTIWHFDITMLQPKELTPPYPSLSSWIELGPHVIDLLLWWSGAPSATVGGATAVRRNAGAADLAMQAVLNLPAGRSAAVQTSRVAAGYENAVLARLCGEHGTLTLDMGARHARVQLARPGGVLTDVPILEEFQVPFSDFPRVQMSALVASLDGTHQFPTVEEGLSIQDIQDAVARDAGFDPEALSAAGRNV